MPNQTPPEVYLLIMIWVLGGCAALAYGLGQLGVWLQRRPEVSSVSVLSSAENDADTQTDTQTDPVSVHYDAIARLQIDRSRTAIIDTLVYAGWDVGAIRGAIKGDNGAIGAEVAEARKRLGVETPTRTIPIREHINGQRIERDIAV